MMRTLLGAISAFVLAVYTALVAAALPFPWNAMNLAIPVVMLLAVISPGQAAIRFAACVGLFEIILMPSETWMMLPLLVIVAFGVGTFYRALFSIPTTGALLAAAVAGSCLYEIGNALAHVPLYYQIGAPNAHDWFLAAGVRLGLTVLTMSIGGAFYRRIVVRLRQAFVGRYNVL